MNIKKITSSIMAIAISCGTVQALNYYSPKHFTAVAEEDEGFSEVTVENVKYKVYSDHAEVNECSKRVAGEVVIPDNVKGISITRINDFAFCECRKITSVVIPGSIKYVGGAAFWGCENLGEAFLPDGLTLIERSTFKECEKLKFINIPDSVTKIGGDAFDHCISLTSVTIPDSVTEIENGAFAYCKNLRTVKMSSSVRYIDDRAFVNCNSLQSIELPKTVEKIGMNSFQCGNMSSFTVYSDNCEFDKNALLNGTKNGQLVYSGIVYGYEGSSAQQYAEKNGYKFVALKDDTITATTTTTITTTTQKATTTTTATSVTTTTTTVPEKPARKLGDENGDGIIDAVDASNILALYVKYSTSEGDSPTKSELNVCDVDGDSKINAVDASKVLGYYVYTSTSGTKSLAEFIKQ